MNMTKNANEYDHSSEGKMVADWWCLTTSKMGVETKRRIGSASHDMRRNDNFIWAVQYYIAYYHEYLQVLFSIYYCICSYVYIEHFIEH